MTTYLTPVGAQNLFNKHPIKLMKSARQSDEQLLKGLHEKDDKAFAILYNRYFPQLCYFAYKLTLNKQEAEEITNTALEIIMRRFDDFKTMENVKAFLYVTVRNRCFDYLRYIRRSKEVQIDLQQITEPTEDNVMNEMIMSEFLHQIYQEIENLPPKRKMVLKLFYLEDMSLEEIGQKLKMSASAVRFNKFKAVEQLRNVFIERKLLSIISSLFFLEGIKSNN